MFGFCSEFCVVLIGLLFAESLRIVQVGKINGIQNTVSSTELPLSLSPSHYHH